jgi:hypothetical protein
LLEQVFRSRGTEDWLTNLKAAKVPGGKVRSVAEVFTAPDVLDRGMITEVPDAVHGTLRLVRSPLRFSDTPVRSPIAPPRLGEHTEEVIGWLDDQTNARKYKFTLVDGFYDNYLIPKLESFFSEHNIEIAAAEFVEDANGNRYVYDLNMNTNYNQQAEQEAGKKKRAMHHVATFLGDLLQNYNIPR